MSTDNNRGTQAQVTGIIQTDWRGYTYPTTAVVERVAAATGRPMTTLPALQGSVDTDALDTVLTRSDGEGHEPVEVSFSYADLRVTVRSDQTMALDPDR